MATFKSPFTAVLPDITSFPEYVVNRLLYHGNKTALVCAEFMTDTVIIIVQGGLNYATVLTSCLAETMTAVYILTNECK